MWKLWWHFSSRLSLHSYHMEYFSLFFFVCGKITLDCLLVLMSEKQRSTKRLKTLTSVSLVLFITQRLFWQRGDGEWEHFKDQTFCHGLRGQPDSLLLSAMRGSSGWWWEVAAGVDRDTDRDCLVFSFSPVTVGRLVRLRARTCSPLGAVWRVREVKGGCWFGSAQSGGSELRELCGWNDGGGRRRGGKHGRERRMGGEDAKDMVLTTVKWEDASWNVLIKY